MSRFRARPPNIVRRYGADPGPDFTAIPYTDTNSAGLIDGVGRALVILRGGSAHDPVATLSVIVSLAAESEVRIPDAVWRARVRHGSSRLALRDDCRNPRHLLLRDRKPRPRWSPGRPCARQSHREKAQPSVRDIFPKLRRVVVAVHFRGEDPWPGTSQ